MKTSKSQYSLVQYKVLNLFNILSFPSSGLNWALNFLSTSLASLVFLPSFCPEWLLFLVSLRLGFGEQSQVGGTVTAWCGWLVGAANSPRPTPFPLHSALVDSWAIFSSGDFLVAATLKTISFLGWLPVSRTPLPLLFRVHPSVGVPVLLQRETSVGFHFRIFLQQSPLLDFEKPFGVEMWLHPVQFPPYFSRSQFLLVSLSHFSGAWD